jgi:hypothetical protein
VTDQSAGVEVTSPRFVMLSGYVLLCLSLSVITSAAAVFVYHALSPAPLRFATLNVAELFSERQRELARLVSENGSEAATEKAVESARAFGKQLEAEALALPRQCGCIVLVRGAVVGGTALPDYTDLVRQRMKSR